MIPVSVDGRFAYYLRCVVADCDSIELTREATFKGNDEDGHFMMVAPVTCSDCGQTQQLETTWEHTLRTNQPAAADPAANAAAHLTPRQIDCIRQLIHGHQDGHQIGEATNQDHNAVATRCKELEALGMVARVGRRRGKRRRPVLVYRLTDTGLIRATQEANSQERTAA